jgi:hypothetical protein
VEAAEGGAPASKAPIRRTLPHWLLEGLFIVISVALGFAVAQFGERRSNRELAARMLASLQSEVEANLVMLEPYVPIHRQWAQGLAKQSAADANGSGFDAFMAARPEMPAGTTTNVPILRRAAWDAALSTGALRLVDYDLAAGLSEIYGMQDYAAQTFGRIPFSDMEFFEPAGRLAAIGLMQMSLNEMVWVEGRLLALYRQHLPAIRAAATGAR